MSELAVANALSAVLRPRLDLGGIAYREHGNGEAIVLIHGVGLNADAWEPQIEFLSRTHRVIAVDMPGHGLSARLAEPSKLEGYIGQIEELLRKLGIATANIVGHSMGGLVAIGFALSYPHKTLRLAVLNSVYLRSTDKRNAVLKRARDVAQSGNVGDVNAPLSRWFGQPTSRPDLVEKVRLWLSTADPQGYAAAYSVFAENDAAFAGRLSELPMPALFATGSLDENSTPTMAIQMASEARRGESLILDGERHMMNLTAAGAVNEAIGNLLALPPAGIDPRDLRKAFGTFMTGVTVVTTRDQDAGYRGFTANSFSSVSLDPPLLLICLSKAAASCDTFLQAKSFAVNILAESQKDISGIFASKRQDKFSGIEWHASALGNPLLEGSVAWFDCIHHQAFDAGDHVVLIGRVESYRHTDNSPLGYARGGYFTLGLEQSAVNAVSQGGKAEVGAILECGGRLVVMRNSKGALLLPQVGEMGKAGSASQLITLLRSKGVNAHLGFLFAVFENPLTATQSIYYRGEADVAPGASCETVAFDTMPWSQFADPATVSMLQRYCYERRQGRYRIYSGDHVSGEIKELSD